MNDPRQRRAFPAPVLAALALAACVPIFSGGAFQTLKLVFELATGIASGEQRVVQILAFPEGATTKKTFVQVSGALAAPDGKSLPSRVKVQAAQENSGGRIVQRITMTLAIKEDGSFVGSKKVKKNIGAGDMLTVTVEPTGGELPRRTKITLCVDLVKKKAQLNDLPQCVDDPGGGPGGGGAAHTLSALQADVLTPACALSGCHNAGSAQAGLVLEAGQTHTELVNVPSTQVSGIDRVEPNDPERSYLIKKLRGDSDISGSRMPAGGPFLSDQELARFIAWIDGGALDN